MQEYLRKLKPSCLEDMIAMNALYRPGPIENIPTFIKRKHGEEEMDCFHADFEEILGETYGVIVYQEQVMLLAQKLSGFSLGGADLLRRAMAKKNPAKMAELQPQFVNGAVERGYEKALAERIWEELLPFCAYAFNKSHSAAYAFIGYQTAYLKAHYGPEFMAANMTSELDSTERLVILMQECQKLGIEILHPDVNSSLAVFTAIEGKISYGLGGIKNVGTGIIEDMVVEREANGPFSSIFDLCNRMAERQGIMEKESGKKRSPMNKRTLESLVMAGALDHLPNSSNRATLYSSVDAALEYASKNQQDRNSGQVSLFDLAAAPDSDMAGEPELEIVEPWPHIDMLNKEKQVLGLYISSHPLSQYQMELKGFCHFPLTPENVANLPPKRPLILGGMVKSFRSFPTKRDPDKMIGIATIEDRHGEIDLFLNPQIFTNVQDFINEESIVLAKGSYEPRKGDENRTPSLAVTEILPIEDARMQWGRKIHLRLSTQSLVKNTIADIQESADIYAWPPGREGGSDLIFHVSTASGYLHIFEGHVIQENIDQAGNKEVRHLRVSNERDFLEELQEILGDENVWISHE
jgi:DNA polymerase-3 subunit alpha